MYYLEIIVIALIVLVIAKFLFSLDFKGLIGLALNALVGVIVIWLNNYLGWVNIPLNIITVLIIAVFGAPGALLLILLSYLHVI